MYDSESAKQFMSDAKKFAEQNRIDRERKIHAENAAIKSAEKNWFESELFIGMELSHPIADFYPKNVEEIINAIQSNLIVRQYFPSVSKESAELPLR